MLKRYSKRNLVVVQAYSSLYSKVVVTPLMNCFAPVIVPSGS